MCSIVCSNGFAVILNPAEDEWLGEQIFVDGEAGER